MAKSFQLFRYTAVPVQSASMVSTLPVDRTLWHCRFVHLHHVGVEDLIKEMVNELELDSSAMQSLASLMGVLCGVYVENQLR